jgi:hypothetical protein
MKLSFIHMQDLSSNLIFISKIVTIMTVVMKERSDPTQRIQILVTSGHPIHISIRRTCRYLQNSTHTLLIPKEFTKFPKLVM